MERFILIGKELSLSGFELKNLSVRNSEIAKAKIEAELSRLSQVTLHSFPAALFLEDPSGFIDHLNGSHRNKITRVAPERHTGLVCFKVSLREDCRQGLRFN